MVLNQNLMILHSEAVKAGTLSASSDFSVLSDADVILVSIQTDKNENGFEPDYGPMFGGLEKLAEALQKKPAMKNSVGHF